MLDSEPPAAVPLRRRSSVCLPPSRTLSFMKIAVPRETAEGEARAALTPQIAGQLVAAGNEVLVQARAGEAARISRTRPTRRRARRSASTPPVRPGGEPCCASAGPATRRSTCCGRMRC